MSGEGRDGKRRMEVGRSERDKRGVRSLGARGSLREVERESEGWRWMERV